MTFLSAAAALPSYRAGKIDEAIEIARQVLARNPNAAEAHMCLAIISLRRNDLQGTVEHLRNCVRNRSAEWILERIRDDFARHGAPSINRELAFRLGAFLRGQLPALGAALAPDQRGADHPFVNVVGTSYVRSFGGSTAFFPLFIGMGPTMLLLTEESAALTRRKFAENLKRVDSSRDTLLVIGGDAYYHVRDGLKTRTHQLDRAAEADFEIMAVAAQRHRGIFADARKTITGRLFFLGSTPTYSPFVDELALRLNDLLRPICQEYNIELIDPWAQLADPVTNQLRLDYSAGAYQGDIHYSLATTPIFIDALKERGVFGDEVSSQADFEWTSVFECDVDKAEKTRIWCEPSVSPNNAFKSDKIASSHLTQRVADLVISLAAYGPERSLLIVNARDGHAATSIPSQVVSGCLAITDSEPNRRAAHMVLDFFGRSDVQLELFGPEVLASITDARFWGVLLMIHPDTAEEDERRCNEVLARLGVFQMAIVATPSPARLANLRLGTRQVRSTSHISNKHIPAKWHDYHVFIVS